MRSMTGFGLGSARCGAGTLRVEIRALNHRFQDIRVRAGGELSELGFFVEQLARASLGRGRFDISLRTEGRVSGELSLDEVSLKGLYQKLSLLQKELAPTAELSLSSLLHLPGVLQQKGPDSEELRSSLELAFREAETQLKKMRQTEGLSLERELRERLGHCRRLSLSVAEQSRVQVEQHAQKLRERIHQLLSGSGYQLATERLEQEVALLADRSDITEELVRLGSHFDQMENLFSEEQGVGRKLDFLLQEVGREINTIGSKSQHAGLAHLVVELKAETEKLREQVQNLD